MTHPTQATALDQITELLAENGFDGLAQAVTVLLNEVMKLERAAALGAGPYERPEGRTGYANGSKPRTLHTRIGPLTVEVPQTRGVEVDPPALERGIRSGRALKLAVAEMDVQGVSTRKVAAITEELCGLEVTSSQASRAAGAWDAEPEKWRGRPLAETPCLILGARYENVRHGGQVRSCAVLVAIGIDTQGRRSILGVSVSLSEAEAPLAGLPGLAPCPWPARGQARRRRLPCRPEGGPQGPADRGAVAAVPVPSGEERPGVPAQAVPPPPGRGAPAGDLRRPGSARGRASVEIAVKKYRGTAPKRAEWLEQSVPEGLAVFARPSGHRRRLRTINMRERLNKELKRRTRVAGLFPNEASALRLVSAVAMVISEEWETNRKYLRMEPD